ncbi:HrpJ domain-containing protein [Ramlibacter sp. MAHUQ-53]|uniref:HrpJ domain-containing protein n=1 Tax=unclassified Ramlibacter TaxID=2617605 RepID=UPI00363E329F
MHPRVDSNAFGPIPSGPGFSQQASTPSGSLRGDACVAKDPARMLADAAEETSRELADKVGQKSLGARQVKAGKRPMTLSIEKCQEYLEKARSLDDKARQEQFTRQCLQTGARQAHEQAGRQAPGNPTEQYALLEMTRLEGKARNAPPDVMARIEAALENLADTYGKEIETRLNTIDAAVSYGETAKEISTFQASFDVLAARRMSVAGTLDLVVRQLAGDRTGSKLESGFDALIAATGRQLAICCSAPEKEHLQAVNTTLNDLKVMNTVKAGCEELLVRTFESAARGA